MTRFGVAALAVLVGCGHAETPPPEITAFTVDPTDIPVGGDAAVHVEVAYFELSTHEGSGTEHAEGETHDEEVATGHVHVYLDDLDANPLLMMEGADGTLTIPTGTAVGSHVLIARLHGEDHLIIEPEVTAEAAIEVLP